MVYRTGQVAAVDKPNPSLQRTAPALDIVTALGQHYAELRQYLRRQLQRYDADVQLAEEALQDLCIELLHQPPAVVRVPLAFLRRAGQRQLIDLYRQQQRLAAWLEFHDELPQEASSGSVADPQRIVAGRQQLQLLVMAIEHLPPRCREVFVLHKIHQFSQADTADHLGISLKSVEKQLRVAMLRCRAMLALEPWL